LNRFHAALGLTILALFGCVQSNGANGIAPGAPPVLPAAHSLFGGKIKHVVIIIQENRTVDNLFNGLPGANTVRTGKNDLGQNVQLQQVSLTAPWDLSHRHIAWVADYRNGNMNGFNNENVHCYHHAKCPSHEVAAYGYVPQSEVQPYWDLAEQYTFANNTFQSNQGPSFPAHQYLVSGTSTIADGSQLRASENAHDPRDRGKQGGCDSIKGTTVATIDSKGQQSQFVYPCFSRVSIMELMNNNRVSWSYYQANKGAGQWHAVDAVRGIWNSPSYKNVKWPSSRVLRDIAAGRLDQVTFITPTGAESDHAAHNKGKGPAWVTSIVNAIGQSAYWKDTAIFVVWDDWGGWYDHVTPTVYNSYELGFRVPLIVIGPYAKAGYISTRQHEFGSILKFTEEVFNLGSLGTTDVRSDDLSDCFNFRRQPRPFKTIAAAPGARYFLNEPLDTQDIDDDF